LKEAAGLPPGMVEDVRNLNLISNSPVTDSSMITAVLAARGLERQAAGDDKTFVENLRIGLSLSRSMRRHATQYTVMRGRENDLMLLKALDRWLERLHGRPDLLRQALDAVSTSGQTTPDDGEDQDLMEDLVIGNTIESPLRWLKAYLRNNGNGEAATEAEAQWIAASWLAPWEHERRLRVLGVAFWGNDAQRKELGEGVAGPLSWFAYRRGLRNKLTNVAMERAGILKLALRLFEADNGKPAETLDQLVPKYLPSLPVDPFDTEGKPFRYRSSHGEEIEWPYKSMPSGGSMSPPTDVEPAPGNMVWPPPAPEVKVPAGQGLLWSVGPDKIDDGGHRQAGGYDGIPLDQLNSIYDRQDIIYLVPLPAKGK